MSYSREIEEKIKGELVEASDTETEIAIASLNDMEAESQRVFEDLNRSFKENTKDADFMKKIQEIDMVKNLERTCIKLREQPKQVLAYRRAFNLLKQIKSLYSFEILQEHFLKLDPVTKKMLIKNKIRVIAKEIQTIMAPLQKRLEKNKKYTYLDPARLQMYLYKALPEGRKHYSAGFIFTLLHFAHYRSLSNSSTFLTQTFINIRNLRNHPEKNPEILASIIDFCEKNLMYKPGNTAVVHYQQKIE